MLEWTDDNIIRAFEACDEGTKRANGTGGGGGIPLRRHGESSLLLPNLLHILRQRSATRELRYGRTGAWSTATWVGISEHTTSRVSIQRRRRDRKSRPNLILLLVLNTPPDFAAVYDSNDQPLLSLDSTLT